MTILFISAVFPYPLHSGGQVRLYNLLKLLSREHDITLYSFIRNENERKYIKNLPFIKETHLYFRGRVWQPKYILRSLTSSLPLLASSYENKEMKNDIDTELKQTHYDLVHLEPFYVCPALPDNLLCPLVIAEHNIEYEVYRSYVQQFPIPLMQPLMGVDVAKIKKQEQDMWKKAQRVIAVSEQDSLVIKRATGNSKVTVIPNGVDTEHYPFRKRIFTGKNPKVIFTGNFSWQPNVKAAELLLYQIWPKIIGSMPQAQLTIVGKHIPKKLREQAKYLRVTYKEFVEDIRDEYSDADILLAPMTISGGTKFKILEAMASGCLVITTKEGMEGIGAAKGIHYIEVGSDHDYLQAIQSVYAHPTKSQTMTDKARELITSRYDWKEIAAKQSDVWKGNV